MKKKPSKNPSFCPIEKRNETDNCQLSLTYDFDVSLSWNTRCEIRTYSLPSFPHFLIIYLLLHREFSTIDTSSRICNFFKFDPSFAKLSFDPILFDNDWFTKGLKRRTNRNLLYLFILYIHTRVSRVFSTWLIFYEIICMRETIYTRLCNLRVESCANLLKLLPRMNNTMRVAFSMTRTKPVVVIF